MGGRRHENDAMFEISRLHAGEEIVQNVDGICRFLSLLVRVVIYHARPMLRSNCFTCVRTVCGGCGFVLLLLARCRGVRH